MSKFLVVSPHPDDAEIALGGLISMFLRDGQEVTIAVCTGEGDLQMVHSGANVPFERRREEQRSAARELGGAEVRFLELAPASKFDQIPQSKMVTAFDGLFGEYDSVALPLPSYNDDHCRVWQAGMTAFRPGKCDKVTVLAYEQPFGNCHGVQITGGFGKRYYPITATALVNKKRAIHEHRSQMYGRDHTIYGEQGAETHARLRGSEIGVHFAELVYVVREIGRVN